MSLKQECSDLCQTNPDCRRISFDPVDRICHLASDCVESSLASCERCVDRRLRCDEDDPVCSVTGQSASSFSKGCNEPRLGLEGPELKLGSHRIRQKLGRALAGFVQNIHRKSKKMFGAHIGLSSKQALWPILSGSCSFWLNSHRIGLVPPLVFFYITLLLIIFSEEKSTIVKQS